MDLEDAVDNGITLDMKLQVYGNVHTTPGKKLLAMGFPWDDQNLLYRRGEGNWKTTFDFSFERAQEAEKKAKRKEAERVAKREAKKGRKRERSPVMDPEVAEMLQQRRQHNNDNLNDMQDQLRRYLDQGMSRPRRQRFSLE